MDNISEVKKVCLIGIVCNFILLVIKLIAGVMSKSSSMIADSIHSIEDAVASILSYIGAKISDIPFSISYPFGRGKIEYIFSFIISITMILASFTMFKSIISNFIIGNSMEFSFFLIIVCIINVLTKLFLFCFSKIKYNVTKDILIKASMEDHRNDMFLSTATLVSIICGYYDIYLVDIIIGIIIIIWILYTGLKLFVISYKVLIDKNLSEKEIKKISIIVYKSSDLFNICSVVAKPVGSSYIVIIKLKIKNIKKESLKYILYNKEAIRSILLSKFSYIYDVIIDIE